MNDKAREKARALRYKRAAAEEFEIDLMRDAIYRIQEQCDEVAYYTQDYQTLMNALDGDEEEAHEFKLMFSELSGECEMLGVEMGEKFKIKVGSSISVNKFKISEMGLVTEDNKLCTDAQFISLLKGNSKLIKPPWKPSDGEVVWYVTPAGGLTAIAFDACTSCSLLLYKLGKLYCTLEEAEAHVDEDRAFWESIRKELEE